MQSWPWCLLQIRMYLWGQVHPPQSQHLLLFFKCFHSFTSQWSIVSFTFSEISGIILLSWSVWSILLSQDDDDDHDHDAIKLLLIFIPTNFTLFSSLSIFSGVAFVISRHVSSRKEGTGLLCPAQICVQNAERDVKYQKWPQGWGGAQHSIPVLHDPLRVDSTIFDMLILVQVYIVLISHFQTFAKH